MAGKPERIPDTQDRECKAESDSCQALRRYAQVM